MSWTKRMTADPHSRDRGSRQPERLHQEAVAIDRPGGFPVAVMNRRTTGDPLNDLPGGVNGRC